jgi:hypothetical protein
MTNACAQNNLCQLQLAHRHLLRNFDSASGCRAVVHACGLTVFPELGSHNRAWIKKLERST